MTDTKIHQKEELTKETINSVFQKTIEILYDTTTLPKECNLKYKTEKIDGYRVYVKFLWIRDFVNYDISCNCWDEVYDTFSTLYDFSKDEENLIDKILEDLEDNIKLLYIKIKIYHKC
jgi:hypothetical protein